ncbi:ankyrin-2-like isoform X7 [Limulus polyphemus]|uniref:Ankyrin-2-like isoform X7 n=1 Tax=Limulus polyphemus TaxID=6850 RepID=A0ABM1BCQ9_LIMPO|nr:ankyrin-2-like isoform X7 [Limulus polyphemus]
MLKMLMKRFPSVGNAIYQLQTDGNASFLRAARAGNLEKVLEYLKGSIDINTSNANGLNALHLASKEGHVNIVSELLKRGANVNAATKKGNTALHIASLAGQEAVVKILVQSGANVNVQSQNGFTPLYMAAQENHDNVVRFLLANGANQSLATEDGFTPLAVALQQGHDKVVAVLLENDAKGRVRLPALHIAAKKDDCKAAALLLQNDHNPDVTSKSGFTPLHIAAHYGNDNIGRLLLEKGAEINYAAKHQITPLHVASKWGKANMATLLLDKGAKIDAFTRDGLTPLHCAARSGHDHVVDLLLEKGAPITAKTKNGLAPLHMASQGDHVDGARILLYHKAPVDDVTVDYLTALHVAAHCGHVRVAKLLLDRKADPNARALNGFTPLHIACKKNRIKVVELLLKHGASIEARTESGLTPLHVAAFMGNMNIVIFLIQHGADPDIPTVRGETPIHLAARANQADIIRILLRNGARVDAKAREHQTPLHIAARLGNVDIVSLLIQHGAAVDATTKDMYTALHIAAKEGQEEVASVLLDNGASLTATTKKGFTPLHLAAKYGNIKVARLLLQKDAPVDAQGKNGVTPLHVAAHYDHVNVALLLLDKGASPHATAKNGYTPLHIAAKKSQMDIATTLLEYGAKANSESKAGFTPLHLAAQEGHTDMTTLLIEHRADVNMKAKNGLTPLHLCGQEDHVNVAAILVKNDAEIDPETNAGYTPLHVACHFGQVNMVRFLLQHASNVNSITSHGYTPLHQAAQQGHTLIISLLLENKASPNALTNQGQTALSIAKRLGYISVVETLKVVTETTTITTTTTIVEEKYKVVAPETMQETFMSDSEDEGGDEIEDTALFGKPTHATHVYLPYYEGQKLQTREDTILGDQSMRYLTADEMKSLGDDSLPIDVTKDERTAESMLLSADSGAPLTVEEDHLSPLHVRHDIETVFVSNYAADNVDISRAPVHAGKLKWKTFLVSFMVDARGGAMRGCRHSGVRVIIPPRKAPMPMRITCRYLRKEKLTHPPPLMEGEACASRILEIGPVGAKFLGPVIIEVPHFASLRRKEREITILRSDNGEAWREHTLEATEEAVQDVLNESFEGEELNALQDLNTNRITQILTTDFPQYFAIITRVRQEVHAIGPEGGMVSSTVVPQVQAIFPEGALTKKIKVGLQAQPIPPELVSKLLGNRVGVSPIVTVEPRRRKFHKPITLTIPVPQAATKGMINQYSGDAPTLRLLCSITGSRMSGGVTKAQWEDVTGSTPLTFVNDCVSFTTTVSARFWLMDCRQVNEVTKYATELYREAVHVPFMAKFVVFAKHYEPMEAQLRVFCMTDDKEEKTLESQENFSEVAKSRDVEVLEGKSQFLEFAGNLVPVTKSGEQLALNFQAFRENRLPFIVRVKDPHQESVGRIAFMREPKVSRGEPPQTPICNLNIVLPDICKIEVKPVPTELVTLEKKYGFVEETGLAKPELIHRADLRLSDIARGLDQDWVQLADQLDVSESEVNNIKKEQPNDPVQQALVMLRLWLQQANEDATGNNLEKALRKIGREDIVNSCMFNVEIVTDDVEKAVAKVHLDQSGFDAFKDELGSSRDASLRRDISLDVSYDEQDIMKEAESAEETSSEAGSVHEKQPSTPVEKKPEEVYQLLQQESQKEVKEHQKDELKTEQMMTPTSQEEIVKLKESENMLQVKHIMEQESTLKEVEVEEQKWEELEKPEEIIEDEEDISSFEEVEKPLEHLEFEHIAGSQTPEEVERPLKHLEFEPITGSRPPEEEERFESLEKSLEQVQEGQTFLSVESISKIEAEDEKWEKIEKLDEEFEEEELSPFEKLEELEDQPKEFKFVLEHEIVTEKVGSEQWKKLEKSKDAIIKETEMNPLTESETLLEKKEPLFELESGIEEKRFREPKTMPLNLAEPFVEKQNKEDNILLELEKPIELGIMFAVEPEAVVVKTKTKINMHEEPEKTQEIEIESMIESDLLKKTEVENQKPEKLEEKSAVQKPEMEELLKPVVVFESEPTEEMPGIEVQEFEEQEVKRVVKTIFDKEEIGELEMPVESDLKPIVQTDPIIKTTENIKLEQLEKTIQPEVKPIIETEPILKTTMKEELQQLEKLLETDLTLKTTEKEELEQLKEIVELDVKPMVEFESIIKKSEVKDKIIEELEKPVETEVESMVELEPFVVLIDEEEPKESEQQPKEIVESLKQKIKLVVDSEPTVNLTKENEKEPKEAKPEVKPVVVTDSGIKLPAEVVKELEEIEKTGVPEVEPVVEQEVEPVVKIESVVELIEEEGLEVKELKREVKLVTVNEEDKKIKELEKSVQPEVIPIVETGFVVIQQEEEQTFEQPLKHELIPLVVTDLVIQPPEEEEKRPKKLEKTGEPEINPVIGLEFTIDHQGQEQKLEKFVESEVIPLTEHEAVVDLIDEDLKESKSEVKPIVVTDLGITSLESEFEKLDTTREVEVKPIVGQEPVVEQEPLEQVVKPVVFTNVIIKSPEEKDKMHEELEKLDKPEARSVVEPEFIVDQQEEEEQKLEEFVESVVIPVAELETVVNQEEKEEKLEEVKSVIVFDYVGEPPEKEGKKFEELEKIGESKIKLVIEPERIVKQEGQRFLQSERQEVKHDFVTKLSEEEDKKYEESEKIIEPEVKSMTELELVVDHQQEKQKLGGTVEPIEQKTKLIIQTEPIPNLIEVKKEQTKESKPDIIPLSVTDFDMKSLEDEEKEIKEPDKTGELEVTAIVESEPAIEQEQNKVEEHLKHTGKPVVVTNLGIKSVEEEQKRHEELVKTVDTKVKSVFEPKLVINQQEEQQKLKESVELLGQEYHPVVEPKSVVNITGIEEEPKEPKLKDLSVVGTDFIIKSPGVEEKIFEELEKVVEPKVKPMVEPEFVVEKTDLDKQKLEELEKILELEIKPVVICEPIVNESEVEEKNFEALEKPKFSSIESKKIISVNKSVEERATPDETTVCYDSLITGHPEERVSSQLEPICEIKSRPSARPAAEEPNEEKIMEPTIAEELFDHKSPPLEPKITTRDVDILPESLTAKHTEEIDDRQTTTTKTETEKLLVDDTTKHSITTVTKTTVVHDLGELPPELRDQMIKQAKSEEWSSSEMGSSHVSFSGLPEDEQSELVTISTTLESEVAERKTEVDSHIDEKAWTETDESGAVQHIIQKEKQSTFTVKDGQSESHPGTEALDSTVHQPQVASDTGREPSHIEPTSPPTEHKLSSHEDKQSPLSRPSPPETTSYSTEQEISPAADYTVYLVPEMQVHVGVSPTESKPAASESGKDEEKQVKKLEEDFDSKLVSEPLSETEKKPLTNMHSSSPQKTYSEIQRTEYAYGSKGSESSDGIEDVSSKVYQVHTWTESTHLSEISQGSEIDVALHETPVGYENTAFAGVDVIDEPAMQEPDSGRATSPYEVLRPSTPTLPIGQDKTVKMDQEIFSQFSKQNMDTSEKDSKTHVEHHIKSQIFNEELDLSIEENTPEKKDILEEKSMIQTEVDRDIIVVQQIRSEIFAHELAEDIENDLPEGKDIPYDQGNAKSKGIIETKAYEEKGEIIDQVISRYDINIAKTDDKQVYENEFSQEKNSIIEKSEWEQKSKIVAVEHVMWETSVQQDSEEIIEEEVKELPREKQIIVEHEENESLEGSVDDSEKIESCDKQKDISSEESRDDEILYSLREEATKVAQDIIEDIKTEVSRCHTLEHSLSEISDEDLVEKSEEYMLSHQEVEYLLKTRDKPEEKRVSFSEDMPEIPQITTEEFETIECDQMHTEEEEHKSKLEHYEHLDDQEKGDTCATFKEVVLSSEQKVYQKETVKGEDSYNESKPSSGIICDKQKKKYITEAQKFPNEVQKTLTQATGDRTDNFSQCLSSFEKIQLDDKLVTFTTAGKETKEESANIMTSEIKLFENVTEEVKEKESDLLSTHAEDDEKMLKESIVEKVQKQDYMSSTPIVLDQKQEEKASSKKQLDLSSFSSYTHVEKCISDDFAKTEKDKEIFDMHLTSGEKIQIVEKKLENIQQPGNETVDVSKKTSVKKSESSENITYRDIQSFTQQKETVILDSSEELIQSLYECDQLMKDEKKTASVQKSTINYQSEDSSFESVDLQEKIIMRDQTISEATIKSDVEKKNESDKLDKFISGRTTDLSELSNLTRKEKQISREGETCSSSGETDSHYYSFEMSDSGRTPRETPATSRPCSSEFDINISAPISSEYETCATSQEVSGDISGSYSTAYTSQEISFATAHSSLSHSSRESAISVDSESSGHLASVEVSSEASETLVPSAQEMEQEFGRDIETPTPDDNEMAQAFVVREPYDSEIPEEVIRGGVEVPFLSDWKTKESFEASYPQSSGAIFSQWSNLIEVHEIPSSPFEIITEEDLADYPGDYLEHISESECLDSHKAEESKLKDKHKLEKNSKEIKSDDIIHEHTATDVVVVSETVQSTVGIEGQRSISDEQTPILDGQLFSDEHTLRSFIYRQESGAYLAAESVDDLTDQMSCSQEELSASESSVTHSEQTWLSSSVETTILATEQQTWPCSGAVSQDQQVTETMHIFAEQQFSTHESSDVVSEQPPERSPYPSDLMLYPQVNGPVEVDYVPEYDAPYPESQEQETEVESTFAEGTPTMFAVTGDSNSNDTQDTSEQTSMVEATRNILLSATGISALVPSQVHQPESERVYDESQELQPPTVSLGHTVSEQCSESDSSEGDIQDIQTIQEIQELQEQEYAQEYETCRAEADEVYFQYYQRQYEENEEETQNLPCEVDKTVDWPESELLEEFYESGKIAEVSEDQVDSEIKSVLSHAVESEQEKDLEDIERPMSPEPPDYSSLGENDSYLPESDQGSVFLQQNIPSAQETSLRHTSVTSTTQFPATKIMSESTSADQQLVTHTEGFSRQFQTDSHISESFEIMDKKEVADTKPEEDTYDIITENEIQTVSSIEKSSSSKIQQGDIMEESLLSKAQRSCGQQSLAESHIATAVSEKFTIQAHQAYKHDIEQDSNFQSKNVMEEDKDGRPSGQKVTYTYGIQFERKQEHDLEEDSFGELYTHREEDEDGFEEIERASKTKPSSCEKIHSSDLNAFAGKKYISKSEQEDGSVSSLQEFENLESGVTIGEKSSLGLVDLVIGKTVLSKSGEVDDISLCSQTEFEQLEKECEEVEHAATKEDFSKSSEIKESYHVQDITEDAESSESDDYEKRMSEIDEIIRQAQTNVEQFHADHDQSLSESAGFTIKLQKYTGTLSSESTESSLMEKTSSQKDDHDIDSLNGNGVLERQVSVEGHMLETNEQSIVHELETRPALPQHIIIGRTVSGHSAESCDSQPRSSTSTVTQYDIESLREREAELEETEAVGDLKSRLFIDQRVEKYGTLEEDKDFMHEEFDHSFHEDSIYEKKEIHAEESSLLSDKSADVDSLLEEKADKDSLQEERDVDQDSLHEEMDLPDDQEAILPGAQKASEQVIIKSSWHQRHLSEDECDKDSLKDEHITGQDTSSSGKDGQGSGGKGDCMISSTDSLEPSSSTATHATYQFETDSVMSSSVNSVHTSGEESTMVSSTDTIEPEVVLSYSVGDMSEATESHKIFSRDQVESHLQLKSEIRSLVKDADKNYKTVISQSMTQPSQLIICLSEESTKPRMSHDVEQVLGKDAETFSAGKSSEVYEEVEAKDESENQVVIHSVEKDIVWQEKLDSTESETDIEEKVKDVIEKQVTGVNDGDETQKDHPTDEKGNLVITKMIKQHLTSEPQVMTYLDEETPESGVASYVKKSFEADKNIAVIQKPSESVEEIETIDASGNQVIICHIKNNITCEANRDITDSERVVEKHLKDFIPKQTIDIDYGDDEVEGHPSVDEKGTVVITKTIKELLNSEPQGPEETLTCQLVTHLDDKTFESGSTSDAVETFKAEKDASIAFKDEPSEMLEEIKTTGVKRNILYEPTISSTDKIEEKLKDLLKEQTLGVGKDHEEVEEHQKVDEKGNVIITRTVKRHVTSEPQIHKKTFMGPDAEKQTKEFFQSFDSLKPTEDEDHYEGVDDEGNMIRVTQKFVVKPEIHTVTFTGPDAHKQMEYFMKTWSESQDGERDSNDAHCHRLNVYTNDSSGEKISSSQAEPQDTQSPPVSSVYFCASSLSKMLDSDDHEHSSSYQTDEGLESDPVFHLKTQEPTSTAGQMLDRGTQQFHFRDVSDGVPLPAASTRHTVYRQDDRTVHFDPREYDHEFHSKFPSHFTCAEEEKEEFGSGHWQQDSGDGHWTGQSTTEARSETTCTSTTVGADGQRCTVTETTTQYGDIEKHGSLQQSMQEILNQFMTDEGSSQTAYHFDDDKE